MNNLSQKIYSYKITIWGLIVFLVTVLFSEGPSSYFSLPENIILHIADLLAFMFFIPFDILSNFSLSPAEHESLSYLIGFIVCICLDLLLMSIKRIEIDLSKYSKLSPLFKVKFTLWMLISYFGTKALLHSSVGYGEGLQAIILRFFYYSWPFWGLPFYFYYKVMSYPTIELLFVSNELSMPLIYIMLALAIVIDLSIFFLREKK